MCFGCSEAVIFICFPSPWDTVDPPYLFIEGTIEVIFNCPGSAGQETGAQKDDLSSE